MQWYFLLLLAHALSSECIHKVRKKCYHSEEDFEDRVYYQISRPWVRTEHSRKGTLNPWCCLKELVCDHGFKEMVEIKEGSSLPSVLDCRTVISFYWCDILPPLYHDLLWTVLFWCAVQIMGNATRIITQLFTMLKGNPRAKLLSGPWFLLQS